MEIKSRPKTPLYTVDSFKMLYYSVVNFKATNHALWLYKTLAVLRVWQATYYLQPFLLISITNLIAQRKYKLRKDDEEFLYPNKIEGKFFQRKSTSDFYEIIFSKLW
jgi:hypothetical protein